MLCKWNKLALFETGLCYWELSKLFCEMKLCFCGWDDTCLTVFTLSPNRFASSLRFTTLTSIRLVSQVLVLLLPVFFLASFMKHLCSSGGYAWIFLRTNGVLLFKLEPCFWGKGLGVQLNHYSFWSYENENVNVLYSLVHVIVLLVLAFKHFWVLLTLMTLSLKTLLSIGNQMRLKLLKQVRLKLLVWIQNAKLTAP